MKRKLIVLLALLLSVAIRANTLSFIGGSYQNKLSANEVIDKYINASGGSALNNVKTVKRKGTLVRGLKGKVPFELLYKSNNKWYYNQVFAYGDQVAYGSNGIDYWVQDTKSISVIEEEEKLDLQLIMDVKTPLNIRKLFPKIAIKESSELSSEKEIILNATTKTGVERELVFDLETGLLKKAGDISFEDYRLRGKLMLPHRIYIGKASKENPFYIMMEVSDVVLNDKIEDAIFNRPTHILAQKKSVLYTLRKQVVVNLIQMEKCVGVYQSITDTATTFTISLQKDHLMFAQNGRRKIEIKPESELDYYIRFLNWECHFVKDNSGKIAFLEFGVDRKIRAKKIM
jgi:hypothetical protein